MTCPCGKPLHYTDRRARAAVERLISALGETINVTTPDGSWRVPRHYIALHGLRADELPALAATLGFEKASP